MSAATADGKGFRAELGFWSLTFLIVGSMIGSGIFFKPGSMLDHTGSVPLVMLAWVGGAIIALSGGLMFAELGAAFPKAGGQYVFLRDGVGRLSAFLFSWTGFTVVQTGTFAAVAVALASAFDRFLGAFGTHLPGADVPLATRCMGDYVPAGAVVEHCVGFALPSWGQGFLAVGIVVLLSVINYFGVRRAAFLNNISTVAKLGALLIILALALLASDAGNFTTGHGSLPPNDERGSFAGFAVALAASLFAYDGFAQATFVAGEVKDARRTVPRAIVTAGLGVAAIYLLTTFAFFHILPADTVSPQALAADDPIAIEAIAHLFSGSGTAIVAGIIAMAIVVSTFGTTNSYILASPRIYHSVAQDGEFPRAFGVLSRFRTPTYGLWFGAIWGGLLVLSGGFDTLSELVVFGLYVFYFLTVIAYFVLLRRQPEAFASFRVPGRPIPAIVFGVGSIYVLYSYVQKDIPALFAMRSPFEILTNTTLFGALLIGSGLAVYAGLRRRNRAAA